MIQERSKDSPNVIACPPLVFLVGFGLGLLLSWLAPLRPFLREGLWIAGGMLCLTGNLLGIWGVRALHRAGTAVRPDYPVTALVTKGPYRHSRNPLYLAVTVIYLGLTLGLGAWWALATLVPTLAVVHWRIVRREEEYLEARFGDEYRDYKTRVRRWV